MGAAWGWGLWSNSEVLRDKGKGQREAFGDQSSTGFGEELVALQMGTWRPKVTSLQ